MGDQEQQGNWLTPFTAEECLGESHEESHHQHQNPLALVQHLQTFFRHTWAPRFVMDFGVESINIALRELPHHGELRSPPGWLVKRVEALANGADPRPQVVETKHEQHKYPEEYRRRRGRYSWEPELPDEEKA